LGEGKWSIKSTHGKWLCGEPTGTVVADRDWRREWEEWNVFLSEIPLYDEPGVLYI